MTRYVRGQQGLVLRYHSICADAAARPAYVSRSISVPVRMFEQQVRRLSRKYRCQSLDEVVERIEQGRPLAARTVVLTFDDGYLDNYTLALPVLAKYRVPATIYLVSSTLTHRKPMWTSLMRYAFGTTTLTKASLPDGSGSLAHFALATPEERDAAARRYTNVLNILPAVRRDALLDDILAGLGIDDRPEAGRWFVSAEQVNEMKRFGVTFGAHTVTHPNLPGIDRTEAKREIEVSKSDLEACLGEPIRHFSYPNSGALYPHFDATIENQVRAAGFRSAATSVGGALRGDTNLFRMERIDVNRSRSPLPDFSLWLERNRLWSSQRRQAAAS
jgi:peptidoglycan/xylan/chitin deacetylase (PgdA/CDA1 family)